MILIVPTIINNNDNNVRKIKEINIIFIAFGRRSLYIVLSHSIVTVFSKLFKFAISFCDICNSYSYNNNSNNKGRKIKKN